LTWPSSQEALKFFPPMLLAGLRCVGAGLLLVVFGALTKQRVRQPGAVVLTAVLAVFNVVGTLVGMTYAVRDLSSGLASLLLYMQPVIFTAVAVRVLGERLTLRRALGVLSGVVGVILLLLPQGHGRVSWLGVALALGAAFSWALGASVQALVRKWLEEGRPPRWTRMTSATGTSVITATLGPQFLLGGAAVLLVSPWLDSWPRAHSALGPSVWALVLTASSAAGWFLYVLMIQSGVPVSSIAAASFAVPLVANVIGYLALGEHLGPLGVLGGVMIVLSILGVGRSWGRRPQPDDRGGAPLGSLQARGQ
jgi:drug/metabolite transporter (DMT)-like permease